MIPHIHTLFEFISILFIQYIIYTQGDSVPVLYEAETEEVAPWPVLWALLESRCPLHTWTWPVYVLSLFSPVRRQDTVLYKKQRGCHQIKNSVIGIPAL